MMGRVGQVGMALAVLLAVAASTSAQVRIPAPPRRSEPSAESRVFLLASYQQFTAADTFEATLGSARYPFVGGGVQVAWRKGYFLDGTISYFRKTGERAFHADGETFKLGIPLTASLLPLELTGGYRWIPGPRSRSRLTPYAGGGIGAYIYKETSKFSSDDGVGLSHVGYLAVAGLEYRTTRRTAMAFDVQYSHVPGILGDGGISQTFGDDDLGGIAVRMRLMVRN